MAITYGFFNSVNGDRKYNADQMSNYFEGLVTDGVYENIGNGLSVEAGSGMNVTVGSGRAIIGMKWLKNDSAITVPITTASATLPRYTAIVARLNVLNRLMTITTVDGTPGSSPVKPTPTVSNTIKELVLAYVLVPANSTSISASNITDTRSDDTVCGWVTGLLPNSHIEQYYKRVKLASGQSNIIPLDMTNYAYSEDDIISIYINGLFAAPNVDYYLDTTADPVELHPNASATGTEIVIQVLKSMIGG